MAIQQFDRTQTLVGFIGPAGVGKDTTAERLGYPAVKFAGPLYTLAHKLSDEVLPKSYPLFDKHMPGGRKFLQQLGAWGRGEISEKHPWDIKRAWMVDWIREVYSPDFGKGEDFWVEQFKDSVALDVLARNPLAVTDVRYCNELDTIKELGGDVYVVACSAEALRRRREFLGYTDASLDDSSEKLARELYGQVLQGNSPASVKVFWADDQETAPDFAYVE